MRWDGSSGNSKIIKTEKTTKHDLARSTRPDHIIIITVWGPRPHIQNRFNTSPLSSSSITCYKISSVFFFSPNRHLVGGSRWTTQMSPSRSSRWWGLSARKPKKRPMRSPSPLKKSLFSLSLLIDFVDWCLQLFCLLTFGSYDSDLLNRDVTGI